MFHQTREGQPIVIVLADGWNHEGMSPAKIEEYQTIKANVLDTVTVGEFKRKFPAWRAHFYDFCSTKKKFAAWTLIEQLIAPLEKQWSDQSARGVAAIRAPVLPADVVVVESPSSSDESEPEVTGVVRGDEEDEKKK